MASGARSKESQSSLLPVALTFILLFSVLNLATLTAMSLGLLDPLMTGTATAAHALVRAAGIPSTLAGNQLMLTNHTLQIDADCTGILLAALYASLVLAYPLSWKTRAAALAVGIPVIAGANMFRLLGVAFASERLSGAQFRFVHDYLFMVFMVLVVVALWAAWLQFARTRATA